MNIKLNNIFSLMIGALLLVFSMTFPISIEAAKDLAIIQNFSAKNQDGTKVSLSDFKGKFLLLYFYPKDDTPGCTKEALSFRDHYSSFKKLNIEILGVSRQGSKSHQDFKAKHQLPFDLLGDEEGSLSDQFEIGNIPILGLSKRKSILFSPEGKVLRFYEDVDPAKHALQIIADVKLLTKQN